MHWLSPRHTRYHGLAPRNIWWFRKELKKFKTAPDLIVNSRANTWKWLYDSLYALYLYQKQVKGWEKTTQDAMRSELFIKEEDKFARWLDLIDLKYFGVKLVSPSHTERITLKKYCSAFRNANNRLLWLFKVDFDIDKESGEIEWCSYNNDWYSRDAFIEAWDYLPTRDPPGVSRIALAKTKLCPVCSRQFINKAYNFVRHVQTGASVCRTCKTKPIENEPQTRNSIYGDYHSHTRYGKWRFFPCMEKGDNTVPLGVELEMQCKQRRWSAPNTAWELYEHQISYDPKWNYFYCERDGSIGEFGLEMITQPMSQKLHYKFWSHMMPKIRQSFTGWKTETFHPGGQYGIHVTFDSRLFGQLNLARLIKFVESKQNAQYIQGLAQRGVLYGQGTAICSYDKKISDVVLYQKGKMVGSTNRNQAINLKGQDGLCEVRMFRSTLNDVSFFKNLEFLWAFHRWCGETPFSFSAQAFNEWLLKTPHMYYDFPNLYAYMAHDVFPCKVPQWDLDNPYAKDFSKLVFILKRGQKDLFEQTFVPDTVDYVSEGQNPCASL